MRRFRKEDSVLIAHIWWFHSHCRNFISIVVAEQVFRRDPNKMSPDGEGFMEAYSRIGRSSGFTEETLNLSITTKQPPSNDKKVSWLDMKNS